VENIQAGAIPASQNGFVVVVYGLKEYLA
jgi:hypothetical protein